jgi:maltooligosyltrehalose trehalohydrolase
MSRPRRRLPIGAEVQPDGGTHFRVWAPAPQEVSLVLQHTDGSENDIALEREPSGYFSTWAPDAGTGTRYRYRLDGKPLADPASRFQPDGPFGPSEVVDPARYRWTDAGWRGVTLEGQVLYEMHVGTFTPEGTWRSAMGRLPHLVETGITTIEVMPIADFPGRFGWGYDGVLLYAPTRLYGTPDDFRAFVDRAHALGLGIILDVVYNHLGPSGSVAREYSPAYFSRTDSNDWGDALNFDGQCSAPVREFFIQNAGYWIDEFHLDGLRLDAIQSIHDRSPEHLVAAVTSRAREAAGDRTIIVVAENERQESWVTRLRDDDGYGLDAMWNDDFHHSAVVAVTGRNEAYYSDHRGAPQEFISAAKYGFLFQGQRYAWQKQPRGSRTDGLPPAAFVVFTENHDQVANSGGGLRIHARTSPGRYRALTALTLLFPGTPMLFQGQEFGASSPFLFFADHEGDLAAAVRKGRAEFVKQFPSFTSPETQAQLPVPDDPATFERCKLHWDERDLHVTHVCLHQDLMRLRRTDVAFSRQESGAVDGAVLAAEAFVLRYTAAAAEDERLLVINFGLDLTRGSFAEPLMAPPQDYAWRVRWSSEELVYGGVGLPPVVSGEGWRIPGHSATVLAPIRFGDRDGGTRAD